MKSPFPGMDPYLESSWGDVHSRLVVYASDQLRKQMPPTLRVRVQEHVTLVFDHPVDEKLRVSGFYPDIRVVEKAPSPVSESNGSLAVAISSDPMIVPLQETPTTERSIEIIDTSSGNRVITTIEVLSRANKVGEEGPRAYRRKQRELLEGNVSLVEIDLLREGGHVVAVPRSQLLPQYREPYRICVVRSWKKDQAEVYRASYRERLPVIRIPLRPDDADAHLDLQAAIDLVYENGDYAKDIHYPRDPDPSLQGEEAIWLDQWLKQQGRR
jgi:hypothetical protein